MIDTRSAIELACSVSRDENLQVTVKESLKGGMIAGTGAVVGGILAGPIGLAVGASFGGIIAAYRAQHTFKSAVVVIMEMDVREQERLANLIRNIVSNLEVTDAAVLMTMVTGNPMLRQTVVDTVMEFLKTEMRMQIVD